MKFSRQFANRSWHAVSGRSTGWPSGQAHSEYVKRMIQCSIGKDPGLSMPWAYLSGFIGQGSLPRELGLEQQLSLEVYSL